MIKSILFMTGILAALKDGRILNLVQPIFTDSSSIIDDNWETDYASSIETKGVDSVLIQLLISTRREHSCNYLRK